MTDPTELVRKAVPLCETFGITVVEVSAEKVVMELDWQHRLCTTAGVLHGGTLMALADSAASACAFFGLPKGSGGTTSIESKTNFLGVVTEGTVVATSKPLHSGHSTIVIETELRVDDRLVSKTTQTQAVLSAQHTEHSAGH